MAVKNNNKQYNKLGEITNGGVSTASFAEIRDAVLRRMTEIYGGDIELSSASADGQYANLVAEIVNNMYSLISGLSSNLNIMSASGAFLDNLCALSNVRRKTASYSTAQVYVMNIMYTTYTPTNGRITATDRSGLVWKTGLIKPIPPRTVVSLTFKCQTLGPVTAEGTGESDPDFSATNNGWIYLPEDFGKIKLYQSQDAIPGNTVESDASLRSRRYGMLAGNAVTTQAALESALYNLEAIEDVYIINNNTENPITEINGMSDNTSVAKHAVYVCLRYKDGVDIPEDTIGEIIYMQLTPGVHTQPPAQTLLGGTAKSYDTILDSGVRFTTHWKKCEPIKPAITVNFITLSGYPVAGDTDDNPQEVAIVEAVKLYAKGLKIGEKFSCANLQSEIMEADLRPNGSATFIPSAATIDSESIYNAPWTYYNYDDATFTFTYSGTTGTLTIS